jgi:general secretion pathway protein I
MSAPSRGFTLLEVLIALAIVAMSVGALMGTVTSSASNVIYLKDKTMAEWVALNRLTEIRIDPQMPSPGRRMGNTVMAGMRWEWEEEVTELPVKGMFRVDVRAHNTGEAVDDTRPQDKPTSQASTPTSASSSASDRIAWTSTVTGVVGASRSDLRQPPPDFAGINPTGQPGGQPGGPGHQPGGQPGTPGGPRSPPGSPPAPGPKPPAPSE